jgi:hypothetical protein
VAARRSMRSAAPRPGSRALRSGVVGRRGSAAPARWPGQRWPCGPRGRRSRSCGRDRQRHPTRMGCAAGLTMPGWPAGGRDRDEAELVERPVAQPARPTTSEVWIGEVPGVGQILAMVAHHEQLAGRDDPARGTARVRNDCCWTPSEAVKMYGSSTLCVDVTRPSLARWCRRAAADPPRKTAWAQTTEAGGENDDVAVGVGVPARGQLVDQDIGQGGGCSPSTLLDLGAGQ